MKQNNGFAGAVNHQPDISIRRAMKSTVFNFAALGFMTGALLTGCGKPNDYKTEAAKENIGKAKQL